MIVKTLTLMLIDLLACKVETDFQRQLSEA